ncbi:hypothetical protein ACOSQ2_030541 [Xanthoceras sorbifolium]
MVINEEFLTWRRLDQFLLGWLLSTVSENLIGQVTECLSSLEAWRTLEYLFSQQSVAKKGSSSIADFILKVKGIGDGLRSAGQVMTDRDNGLVVW